MQRVSRWLLRGAFVGVVFAVAYVIMLLNDASRSFEFATGARRVRFDLPQPSTLQVLSLALLAFILGFLSNGLWNHFARSRIGLFWAILVCTLAVPVTYGALTWRFFTSQNTAQYEAYSNFSDEAFRQAAGDAVATFSTMNAKHPLLENLSYIVSPLLGAALWAGLRFAALRRL